jgi:bifunctional DNA-binding transcriptional regulator/antitoxin component of YhaV-PrlF toxin-antitoxin module
MARKRLVDHNALIQAVEMGKPSMEIMQQFGFKSLGALKVAYMDALIALEKVPAIKKKTEVKKVNNLVGINGRGSLVIPKKLVDALGLDETALFAVERKGDDLYLKTKKRPPKTILRKKEN